MDFEKAEKVSEQMGVNVLSLAHMNRVCGSRTQYTAKVISNSKVQPSLGSLSNDDYDDDDDDDVRRCYMTMTFIILN